MDCVEVAELLAEYSLEEIVPEQRAAVAAHLTTCETCREKWGVAAESQMLHAAVGDARSRAGIRDRVMARLGKEPMVDRAAETRSELADVAHIKGFDILGRLGRGGMGSVYRARQRSMDRVVALKILAPHLAENQEFVTRFTREAHTAAAVAHPNIIEVYDIGQDGDIHYIAMEFLDGESLKEVIAREGRVSTTRACDIMRQVAAALAEAHEGGVLHRDIKPSNILITKKGLAKVADFGLAKRPGTDMSVTRTGQSLGTPLYFAPEAARGQPLDARSDLYSFGATFYHALAGRPPFEGGTATELAVKHTQDDPLPLAQVAPDVHPALCRIIDRLLQKNPARRYQTARELMDALMRLERQLGVSDATQIAATPRGSFLRILGGWGASHPRRVGVAVGVVIVLLLAAVGTAFLVFRRPQVRSLPTAARTSQEKEARVLFDGKTLNGWRLAQGGFFKKGGAVWVEDGCMVLDAPGDFAAGVVYAGEVPLLDYEITFEAMRVRGEGNAGSLAFPFGARDGAWAVGNVARSCGLDIVDGAGDSEQGNPTRRMYDFVNGQWYRFRLRVDRDRIQAWINDEQVIDFAIAGHTIELWKAYRDLRPLGLYAARFTRAKVRNIRLRRLKQ